MIPVSVITVYGGLCLATLSAAVIDDKLVKNGYEQASHWLHSIMNVVLVLSFIIIFLTLMFHWNPLGSLLRFFTTGGKLV